MNHWYRRIAAVVTAITIVAPVTRSGAAPPARSAAASLVAGSTYYLDLEVIDSEGIANADVVIIDMGERDQIEQLRRDFPDVASFICYFSIGTRESFRAENDLPSALWDADSAAPLEELRPVPGVEGEYWIDTSIRGQLLEAVHSRIRACKAAGATGVIPDWPDSYLYSGAAGLGEKVTYHNNLDLARDVAKAAHDEGLTIGLRNFHEAVDELEDRYDFALVDQCLVLDECADFRAFTEANKPVFDIEYVLDGARPDHLDFWYPTSMSQLCRELDEQSGVEVDLQFLPVDLAPSGPKLSCT